MSIEKTKKTSTQTKLSSIEEMKNLVSKLSLETKGYMNEAIISPSKWNFTSETKIGQNGKPYFSIKAKNLTDNKFLTISDKKLSSLIEMIESGKSFKAQYDQSEFGGWFFTLIE